MRRTLHDAWWRLTTTPPDSLTDTVLGGVLQGGAVLYGLGVGLRNAAYDRGWLRQARLSCPVISVGNLAVGGTGKTTCVAYLADKLRQQGRRVAILSRGYGGRVRRPYWLLSREGRLFINGQQAITRDGPTPCLATEGGLGLLGRASPSAKRDRGWGGLPDEPQLLAAQLSGVPILVGTRREQTGKMATEACRADVVILDDGLQYRRLARDCEIVLVNARMPLNGWPLLPRGPMREPLTSLRRADVIIITKADQSFDVVAALQERLKAFNPTAVMGTAIHEPEGLWDGFTSEPVALDRLANSRVSLLSSIGDPEGFEQTVRRLGATVVSHAAYPDHHRYELREWQQVVDAAAASGASALVTTEKDLIRLRHVSRIQTAVPVWVLRIRMRLLSGDEGLDARLVRVGAR